MRERYERALALTAPRIASTTPGLALEGYWLDNDSFFFIAEYFEPAIGRVAAVPSIAEVRSRCISPVISLDVLKEVISSHSGMHPKLEDLAQAEFAMRQRDTLAVAVGHRGYLIDPKRKKVIAAYRSLEGPALYSPDGRYACFIKEHDLWLLDRERGAERALTTNGLPHLSYGRQPECSLNAISYRKWPIPMGLWSPDSQWFLTHRVDERNVPELPLIEHVPPAAKRPVLHTYKYPMPGDQLPAATFIAIHAASGRVVSFDDFPFPVLAFSPFAQRMVWFSGDSTAWFLRLDRYFRAVDLIKLDLASGTGWIVLSENVAAGYIDLNPIAGTTPNVRALAESHEVVWFSERDGWGHLYLYDALTGKLKNRITRGEWLVRDIVHIDESTRKVLFLAGGMDPTSDPARRSLCAVHLDGSGLEILLEHHGDISVPRTEPSGLGQENSVRPAYGLPGISADAQHCVARFGSVATGNQIRIVNLRSGGNLEITSVPVAADEFTPQPFSAIAADGTTRLHGVMCFPPDFREPDRYPLVDYIYAAPHNVQQPQFHMGMNSMQARALAALGFITIMLDSRGTPGRSRDFHQAGYGKLLEPQLADHVAVIRQLSERHAFIDSERVGVFGASGGGAAAARALFDYGQVFTVGVSVCGNHDSSAYAAVWSDKYRGTGSHDAWRDQSNATAAHKLQGTLLLVTGELDENVHVSQTLSLVDALIRANKDFDLLIVPNEGHGLLATNGYVQRRVWDYLVCHLLHKKPPSSFEIAFEPHELARYRRVAAFEARY